MSAFFLYIHKDRPLGEKALQSISEQIVHFPWVKTSVYSEPSMQLVHTANKSDRINIFEEKAAGLTFILHGNIFESTDGIEKIDEQDEKYTLKKQLISRYLKGGIASCVGLNGMYNLLVWNKRNRVLEIAGDRLGIFQIFFARINDDSFVLTTDIITLKSVPGYIPKIDRRGIFDLLYAGIAFESRTVLEGVDRLLIYACYRVSGNKLVLLEAGKLSFSKKRWDYITPTILDDLEHYYVTAIKRQLQPKDRVAYFQSGGKDSRAFSYFLKKAQIIPQCITAGENYHGEVFLAKQVSRELGFPWQRLPLHKIFSPASAEKILMIDSYSRRIFATWVMEMVNSISMDYDYVLTTLLGDNIFVYILGKIKAENYRNVSKMFEDCFDFFRKGFLSDEDLARLFPKNGDDWIAEYQKDAYKLFNSLGEEPYQMAIAYELRANSRFKVGASVRTINAAFPTRVPYIDTDLVNFIFSLPPCLLYKRSLLDMLLTKRARRLGAIPLDQNSDEYSALVPSLRSGIQHKIWHAYTNKIKIPFVRFFNPVSATTQFYVNAYSIDHSGFQNMRERALADVSCLEGIVNIPMAKSILQDSMVSCRDHILPGNSLRALMTSVFIIKAFS